MAKRGSKLKEPADPSAEPSSKSVATARGRVTVFTNEPLSGLFPTIEASWRHRVVDKTGLLGKYDFSVSFPLPPRASASDDGSSDADLTSVLEDLGLKLERKKGPVRPTGHRSPGKGSDGGFTGSQKVATDKALASGSSARRRSRSYRTSSLQPSRTDFTLAVNWSASAPSIRRWSKVSAR